MLYLNHSLINRDAGSHTYDIHRLVQAVLKDGMEKDEQKLWAERVVKAVNCAFPEVIVTPVIVATKKPHCTSFGSCII